MAWIVHILRQALRRSSLPPGRLSRMAVITTRILVVVAIGLQPAAPARGFAAGTTAVYGSMVAADSLGNTQIGGTSCGCVNGATSFRFRAATSSALETVLIYLVAGPGYSGGTGGTLEVAVETDDLTTKHRPSGNVLARIAMAPGNPIDIGVLPTLRFPQPPQLTAGQLYHLVFRNLDASPTVNFISVDSLISFNSGKRPRQLGWGQLLEAGRGWQFRPEYTPILALQYADGVTDGVGYMEVWVRTPKSISGANMVRQIVTPSAPWTASSVSVRLKRTSGASPLTITLERADGTVLASGQVAASDAVAGDRSPESGAGWVTLAFGSPITLEAGPRYHVVLSAPSDTEYLIHVIRKGTDYRFPPSTYFADGHAEHTVGAGWLGMDQLGGYTNSAQGDLQFYFR